MKTNFIIAGPMCPGCESDGSHDINAIDLTEDGEIFSNWLHCRKCEKIWEERVMDIPVVGA